MRDFGQVEKWALRTAAYSALRTDDLMAVKKVVKMEDLAVELMVEQKDGKLVEREAAGKEVTSVEWLGQRGVKRLLSR